MYNDQKQIAKRLFILFISIISLPSFSQNYYKIISSDSLSIEKKELILDSLFLKSFTEKETIIYEKDSSQLGDYIKNYAVWLYRKGDILKAIHYAKTGVKYAQKRKPYKLKNHYSNLLNLGLYYKKDNDYLNSNNTFLQITKLSSTNHEQSLNRYRAEGYFQLGKNLITTGDTYSGISYLEKSQTLYKNENLYNKELNAIIRIAFAYQKTIKDAEIHKGLQKLREIDSFKDQITLTANNRFDINEAYANLYNTLKEKPIDTCLKYYKNALNIALNQKHNRKISVTYNNIGTIYHKINIDSALYFFRKAQKYKHNSKEETARTLLNIGVSHFLNKEYDQAITTFNTSLDTLGISTKIIESDRFSEKAAIVKEAELLIQILKYIGSTWLQKFTDKDSEHFLHKALVYFQKSDQLIDLIKLENSETKSKLYWREQASDLYINIVDICSKLNKPEMVYHYIEKNKALLLLEDLNQEQLKRIANIPENLIQREFVLKRKIARIKNTISLKKTEGISDALKVKLFDQKEQYNDFIDSLKVDFPNYHNSKKNPPILDLSVVKTQAQDQDIAFLEYIINDDKGFGLLVTGNHTICFTLENIPTLLKNIQQFNSLISRPFSSTKDKSRFQKIGKHLYQTLLPKHIRSNLNEKIIIVPDYLLNNIPFDGLIKSDNSYVIENHEISYAYSISSLEQNKKLKRIVDKEFLGFAPVDYAEALPKLPNSKNEVEEISSLFGSSILVKNQASKKNLINAISTYKIIHLSTHANANDSITPWIATVKNKITLNDIYATKNNAELVVLSACNTSLGKIKKGEGVMSLARGFFNTGANSVLSTLWKADDRSTLELNKSFYTYLKKGKSKSESLRLAKLDYINSHSLSQASPYYWSSLILIGDSDPIYSHNIFFIILLGVFISILLFIIYKKISTK